MINDKQVELGVRDAVDFWLSQHPVSLGEIFHEAVKQAVREWFAEHEVVILDMIKDSVRQGR